MDKLDLITMFDFNFHTECNSVVARWGQSIQGKNGLYDQPFGTTTWVYV